MGRGIPVGPKVGITLILWPQLSSSLQLTNHLYNDAEFPNTCNICWGLQVGPQGTTLPANTSAPYLASDEPTKKQLKSPTMHGHDTLWRQLWLLACHNWKADQETQPTRSNSVPATQCLSEESAVLPWWLVFSDHVELMCELATTLILGVEPSTKKITWDFYNILSDSIVRVACIILMSSYIFADANCMIITLLTLKMVSEYQTGRRLQSSFPQKVLQGSHALK
ncbi:unnamed protein product [Dovyalis caffra]|uniref:Uncharacterized protein n=1 Tax=Dovyalis caffra TaxID=77055 RepID=A0AAV1S9H5_9ROSI|nr:unnamed protein product [Dovyalis caffra]